MKYQGVYALSVRTYLGFYDGADTWSYQRHVVGIKEEEGKIRDFKTGEIYNFVTRNEDRCIALPRENAKEGEVYAIETVDHLFDQNKIYSERQINKIINSSNIFFDEYKRFIPKREKVMFKN